MARSGVRQATGKRLFILSFRPSIPRLAERGNICDQRRLGVLRLATPLRICGVIELPGPAVRRLFSRPCYAQRLDAKHRIKLTEM